MSELASQLRTYFDAIDPPFTVDELLTWDTPAASGVTLPPLEAAEEHRPPQVDWIPPHRSRPRWVFALVALVVTLLVLGGSLLLLRPEGPMVDEPTPTTVEEPQPTTVVVPIPVSGFAAIPIDTEGVVGQSPAIAIAPDGNPVMAYQGQNDVNVAVCTDPACTSLRSVVTIAENGTVSSDIGPGLVLLPDGSPAVAYGFAGEPSGPEGSLYDLLWTVCDDPACSTWTTTVIVEQELVQGPAVTMTGDGRPVIAYFQRDSGLRLAVCDDSVCSDFSTSTVDQAEWGIGQVAAAPGEPPAFLYVMDGDTRLVTCGDASCGEVTVATIEGTDYWTPAVTRGPDGIVIVTLDQGEGEPEAEPSGDIMVITCRDTACQESTSAVIGTVTGVAIRGVAVDPAGHPVLAYSEAGGELKVTRCNDPQCGTGTATGHPAGSGDVALAIGSDGNPLLAYHTGSDLVLIRCADPACVDVPPPAPAPEALSFSDPGWTLHVAADDQAVDRNPTVVFDTDGLPVIFHETPRQLGPDGEIETSGFAVTFCADQSCSRATTSDPLAVDLGFGGSFALDGEGLPVAVFWRPPWSNDTGRMLGYARCDDPACSSATHTELFEGDAAAKPDIAIGSDGLMVMAFQNMTINNGPIQVAFCVDMACSSVDVVDLEIDCVDAACERYWVHNTVTLALTPDDRPVVVYASPSGRTRLMVCDDPRCSTYSAQTLDDNGSEQETAQVAIGPDGNPIIGYYTDEMVRLAFCLDPFCDQVTIAELGDSAQYMLGPPRVAVLGEGRIAVGFASPTYSNRLAVCSYPCSDPTVYVLADGLYTIAAGPDGLPLIAFAPSGDNLDEPPSQLVVAKCTEPDCLGG